MVPNLLHVIEQTKTDFPRAWADAHTGNAHTEDFIGLCAARCHAIDPKFGLLGQRGDPGTIADDALLYAGEGPGHDPTNGNKPVTGIDVIASAGSASAAPAWQVIPTGGPAAWVAPGAGAVVPAPIPPEPAKPVYPTYEELGGDAGGKKISRAMDADYRRAGRPGLDADCGAWMQRTAYDFLVGTYKTVDESIAAHRAEWCAELGIPVA